MQIQIHPDKAALGRAAADEGAAALREALAARGRAVVILATGASQFDMLENLVASGLDWSRISIFHLDEYVGLPVTHPASFRKYLRERVLARLPVPPAGFHAIDGDAADTGAEIARLNALIAAETVDVCFAGIGENGHLAFNDPPADFDTTVPFLRVRLDDACRRQQMGEGWFPTLDDVPAEAISMSIREILRARRLVLSVPDTRKAEAVRATVEAAVSPEIPASIIRNHPACSLHLDRASAALLAPEGAA
ncbi:glucosamine-6-phosphate deaminase [Szabonella alba]|uniref:Glucosamine-6-phosphate deaminase n=1 Tax=Szabonella alba TaxID=2804194 RepID=A0A8K0Y250_9RHOB|nr:glucosamine-6-phosphate deaminase [Szabonella alba]MBL4919008.1 glucosamine-6-phosphate deaminase [Szabonella alba]